MGARKSPKKSTRKPSGVAADPSLRGNGRGPAKGAPNAGRPPDEFKAALRAMGSRADVLETVARVINDPTHPAWQKAVAMVWDRGYDRAAQSVDVTSQGEALASFTLGIGTA